LRQVGIVEALNGPSTCPFYWKALVLGCPSRLDPLLKTSWAAKFAS